MGEAGGTGRERAPAKGVRVVRMTRPRRVGRVRGESFSGRCNGYSGANRPADRMSNREPDFEFDFFDEPPTEEASGQRSLRRPLGGGPKEPRGPRRPIRPAAGFTPLARLVGLVAFAILIVVLLVLWVQSCQEDQRRDAYRSYLGDVVSRGARLGAARARAERRAHDAGDQAGRSRPAARRARPAAADRS